MRSLRIFAAVAVLAVLHACSSTTPPPPESVQQAFNLAGEGHFKQAVSLIEKEEKAHPKDPVYPFYLGRLTAQYFNDIYRGKISFRELKKLPHKPFGQYLEMKNPNGTIAGYQFKDVTPVLNHYLRAIRKDARFTDAYLEAAMLYASLFEIEKGIALLQSAMRIMPDNYRFPYLLAYINRRLGRTDRALALFRKAASVNPDAGEAHLQVGLLLLTSGHPEDAARSLSRVIDINANEKDVDRALKAFFLHFYKEGITGKQDALEKAVIWGEKYLELFRKRPRMLIRLGKACYLAGKKKAARRYLKEGLDEIPIDSQALTFYGELQADEGNTAGAIETYNRSLMIQDRSITRYMLGSLLVRLGKPSQGVVHLRRAAAMKKDDPEILYALADALEKAGAGKPDRRQAWKNYLDAARAKGHNRAGIESAEKKLRELGS